MRFLISLLVLGAMFIASSFGQSPIPVIDGTYFTPKCRSASNGLSVEVLISLHGSGAQIYSTFYNSPACSGSRIAIVSRSAGFAFNGQTSPVDPSAYAIDFTLNSIYLTVFNSAAQTLAQQPSCNVTATIGLAADVSTATCPIFEISPMSICSGDSDLVALRGKTLTFGRTIADLTTMCNQNTSSRPTSLLPQTSQNYNNYVWSTVANILPPMQTPMADIDGIYTTRQCERFGPFSMIITLEMFYPRLVYSMMFFKSPNCQGDREFSIFDRSYYSILGESSVVRGAYDIDLSTIGRFITFYNQSSIDYFNAHCKTNFTILHDEYDLTYLNCSRFGIEPVWQCPVQYDVVKVEQNVITFGNATDRTALCQSRPRALGRRFLVDISEDIDPIPAPAPVYLSGTYTTRACTAGQEGSSYHTVDLTYPKYVYASFHFEDNECKVLRRMSTFSGYYSFAGSAPAVPGANQINMVRSKNLINFYNQTDLSNFVESCKLPPSHSTQLAVPIDITYLDCPHFGIESITKCPEIFDIVQKMDTALYMGQHPSQYTSMCNVADRPSTLNPNPLVSVASTIEPPRNPPPVDFDGIYTTRACERPVPSSDFSLIVSIDLSYPRNYYNMIWFDTPDCSGSKAFSILDKGYYQLAGNAKLAHSPTAYNFNSETRGRFLTFYNQSALDFFNSMCQTSFTQLGEEIDVSYLNCSAFRLEPLSACPVTYDIIKKQGNFLMFGETRRSDMCKESNRPKMFGPRTTLTSVLTEIDTMPDPAPFYLSGSYTSPYCNATTSGTSHYQSIEITYPKWALTRVSFSDAKCLVRSRIMRSEGTYKFVGESQRVAGAHMVDFTRTKEFVIIYDQATLTNFTKDCKLGGMMMRNMHRVGAPIDMSLNDCVEHHIVSVVSCPVWQELLMVNGSELYLGASNHLNRTALCDQRPTALQDTQMSAPRLMVVFDQGSSLVAEGADAAAPAGASLLNTEYELNGDAILGIVIACLVVGSVMAFGVFKCMHSPKHQKLTASEEEDNMGTSMTDMQRIDQQTSSAQAETDVEQPAAEHN